MTDQPWIPDPTIVAALRKSILEAQTADRQTSGPDPNADLLADVQGETVRAFRASNPQIYDKLSAEFNTQFSNVMREGLRMGMELAITVAEGVVRSAQDDDDVSPSGHAYLQAIPQALRTVSAKAQSELGAQDG